MRATRRTWTAVAAGLTLVLLAVVADRPLLMFGGLGIGAWLLARQYAAYRSFRTVHSTLSVSVTPARDRALVEQEVRVTVTAQLDQPAPASVQITIPRPTAALGSTEADRTVSITRGDASAATTVTYSFPTAGRFALPAPVVSITDDDGLFTETFERGESPVVHVDPADPGDAYIGRGGDVLATTYGEHPAARGGSGLTPAELREYLPGDSLDQIDWKATARLDTPYVREFEAETDRRTVLIVDHRDRMAHGRRGMTQFEYAREVALGFVRATEASADPLGCWTIGDTGVTSRTPPVSTPQGYATIRERLRRLTPTHPPESGTGAGQRGTEAPLRPAVARTRATLLDDESPFATQLSPFFELADPYVQRFEGDALYEAVRRLRTDVPDADRIVLLTDDADRDRLREVVRLATRGGTDVLVFLTPRVLFKEPGLDAIESTYASYVDFVEFRRELEGLPNVTAFEVGPGDRLDALLASRARTTA